MFAFALMRLSTAGIRAGWWPFGNVRLGGRHIHHFVPGILIAFGSGALALLTDNARIERTLAVPFGAGIGLTFDEAALLLDFRDVYWTREGVLSVQVSCGLAATLAGTILALRMLRRGEEQSRSRGSDPAAALSGGSVATEELSVVLQQPDELERPLELRQPDRKAGALAAGELGRVGDEELVHQAGVEQLGVGVRAALAEQGTDAALAPKLGQGGAQVDLACGGRRGPWRGVSGGWASDP